MHDSAATLAALQVRGLIDAGRHIKVAWSDAWTMRDSAEPYSWRLGEAQLQRLAASDRRAAAMIGAVEPEIRAYLAACINDREEREDAIADALADAFDDLGEDTTVERVRESAFQSARRQSALWKQRNRHIDRAISFDFASGHSSSDDARASSSYRLDLATWLEGLLASLREGERLAFESHVTDDADDTSIAATLGVSRATVRKLRERGKRTLRFLVAKGPRAPEDWGP